MHYIKQITLCGFLFFLSATSQAQATFKEKNFGTVYNESCFSFIHTSDNGYAILGATSAPGAGDLDIYFTKLDSNENVLWTKIYGGAGSDQGGSIKQTADGGYLICGNQYSFGAGGSDGYIIRTDGQGTIIWSKAYGLAQNDILWKIEPTTDSNYIAMGTTYSPGNHTGDILVVKINGFGDTLWTRIIGDTVYDSGISLTPTNDGGCAIVGRVYSYGAGLRDVMLSRIDGSGNVLWLKTFGGIYTEEGMAVAATSDSGFIITGATETFSNNGYYDVYMIKTDSAGNLIWSKTYGGDKIDATYNVIEAPDGGYVVSGFTDSWAYLHLRTSNNATPLGDDSSHVLIMKVTNLGDTVWTRAFGGTKVDEAYALINAPDGGYFIGAYSNSFSGTDSLDAYIIHTDSMGVSDCHTYFVSPHIGNPNTIQIAYTPNVSSGLIVTNAATQEDTITFIAVDPCLGVSVTQNNFNEPAGIIFPNPFSHTAAIALKEIIKTPATLKLYNVFGVEAMTETVPAFADEIKIERKNLSDGIYFLELIADKKIIFRTKVAIKK